MVRQVEGTVLQRSSSQVFYINVGAADQVRAGMIFHVHYSPADAPNAPPIGPRTSVKAALEVVAVGARASECRLIGLSPGQSVAEGDVVVNEIFGH